MLKRFTIAAVLTVFVGAFSANAVAAPPTDFWINKYFMNMAHQGGETEVPGNTLYAFKTAAARGADVIEMDGYLTADGEFVITHDMEPHKTSNAPFSVFDSSPPVNHVNEDGWITNQTLEELRQYDFAYKFKPGTGHYGYPHQNPENEGPASDYIYRGIATGDKPAPDGFSPADFKIATLEQVLDALPDMPMSVDMKAPRGDLSIATAAATEVARIMNEHPERSEDVLIVSFFQESLDKFHELAPNHKALGGTESGILSYVQGNPITPTPVAVQPPDTYNLNGTNVDTIPILKPKTDADGYALHVWPANGSVDGPELWQKMIDQGANGFFTDKPSQLHAYLCETGVPRPDGRPRCPAQACPAGQTGFAPDNCELTPGLLSGFLLTPKRGKIVAGRNFKVKLKLTNSGGAPLKVTVGLRSSNQQVKVRRSIVVTVPGLKSVTRTIPVKATRKAKRRAVITARTQGKARSTTLTVKPTKKKQKKRGRR